MTCGIAGLCNCIEKYVMCLSAITSRQKPATASTGAARLFSLFGGGGGQLLLPRRIAQLLLLQVHQDFKASNNK